MVFSIEEIIHIILATLVVGYIFSGMIKFKKDNFSFKRFGAGSWVIGRPNAEHIEEVQEGFEYLKSCFDKDYDIIIADEILYAVQLKLLEENKIVELIKNKPKNKELILTGMVKADLWFSSPHCFFQLLQSISGSPVLV